MFYLTFNDPPSGVFFSQVTDVVKHFNERMGIKIRLVSFLSLRHFVSNRRMIKQALPAAIVLPMFPGLRNWRLNKWLLTLLCLCYKPHAIIARGIFAANLALDVKNEKGIEKVVYDGRGAIKAEWEEYIVDGGILDIKEIEAAEKRAVLESNFRIAVSEKLAEYWKSFFDSTAAYVVIPCTYNSTPLAAQEERQAQKAALGFSEEDIVLVYAGSVAGWQSLGLLIHFLEKVLQRNRQIGILFLSKESPEIQKIMQLFPGRVKRRWAPHHEVPKILSCCDYGLLLREQSITNSVSSPTKFAEYLAAGLRVIISEHTGDYTAFVEEHACGIILHAAADSEAVFTKTDEKEKQRVNALAINYFSKQSPYITDKYSMLLSYLQ